MTDRPDLSGAVSASSRGGMLTLTVTPRSAKNLLELQNDGTLRIRLTAPPVEGAANNALLKFLADALELPRSQLTLASGETSRHKRVLVSNFSAEELSERLLRALDAES